MSRCQGTGVSELGPCTCAGSGWYLPCSLWEAPTILCLISLRSPALFSDPRIVPNAYPLGAFTRGVPCGFPSTGIPPLTPEAPGHILHSKSPPCTSGHRRHAFRLGACVRLCHDLLARLQELGEERACAASGLGPLLLLLVPLPPTSLPCSCTWTFHSSQRPPHLPSQHGLLVLPLSLDLAFGVSSAFAENQGRITFLRTAPIACCPILTIPSAPQFPGAPVASHQNGNSPRGKSMGSGARAPGSN